MDAALSFMPRCWKLHPVMSQRSHSSALLCVEDTAQSVNIRLRDIEGHLGAGYRRTHSAHRAVITVVIVVSVTVIPTMKPTGAPVSSVISPSTGSAGMASSINERSLHICFSLFFTNLLLNIV